MNTTDKAAEALRLAHVFKATGAHDLISAADMLCEYAALLQAQPAEAGRVPLTDEQRNFSEASDHNHEALSRLYRHHGILPKEQP